MEPAQPWREEPLLLSAYTPETPLLEALPRDATVCCTYTMQNIEPGEGCEQGLPPPLLFPENITQTGLGSKEVVLGHTVCLSCEDGHGGRRGVLLNPRGPFQQHKWKKAGRQDDTFPTLVRTGGGGTTFGGRRDARGEAEAAENKANLLG